MLSPRNTIAMPVIRLLMRLLVIAVSGNVMAGEQTGRVTSVVVSGLDYAPPFRNPSHVLIKGDYRKPPACATTGHWALNTSTDQGKAMLSLLLAAYGTGKPVTITGTGQCSLRPDMETAFQVGLGVGSGAQD